MPKNYKKIYYDNENRCSKIGRHESLVGRRYGKLVVISQEEGRKRGMRVWKCLCDCGNEKLVTTENLQRKHVMSCGCLRSEELAKRVRLPNGVANFNFLFHNYENAAKYRGKEFSLTKEQFRELTSSNCFYCGKEPSQVSKWKNLNGIYKYNGLDRVDSSKGYNIDNVVPCCGKCNMAKSNMEQEEFYNWIKQVYFHSIVGYKSLMQLKPENEQLDFYRRHWDKLEENLRFSV